MNHLAPLENHSHENIEASATQSGGHMPNNISKYPYIIVGSGMGGGMVARQLFNDNSTSFKGDDSEARVMLLEKGGLGFHTHCLNTSRAHFAHRSQGGRGRDNEVMFDQYLDYKRTRYELKCTEEWCGGGSVFELGGRSLFWSLEAPSIRHDRLKHFFPPSVATDLEDENTSASGGSSTGDGGVDIVQVREGWYTKAKRILANSPPGDVNYPSQNVSIEIIDEVSEAKANLRQALGMVATTTVDPTPNGAEFADANNLYYFAQNAYSTLDWILDKAINQERQNSAPLAPGLNLEVKKFTVKNGRVTELFINNGRFEVSRNQTVILCAGTVNTAAIALRSSGLPKCVQDKIGKNLTDHEIWMTRYWKKMNTDEYKAKKAIELSGYVRVRGHEALLTVCQHAEKFYGHGFADGDGDTDANAECVSVLNIMFEFEAELNTKGAVSLDYKDDPVIEMNRERLDSSSDFVNELNAICRAIRFQFGFLVCRPCVDQVQLASWGSVAHEVGTMRMDSCGGDDGVVDSNLKVKGVDNLYVCDLSVFPCSPMENPSATLTALAMRLAAHLKDLERDKTGNE